MSIIATERELRELIEHARRSGSVALDTEFVWERTYYPQLGLIQLAISDEDCYLIDPLAIKDLSVLGSLLADPAIVKILHDAPQDLTILSRATGAVPAAIFDTRVAAGFAGLSATISLADLIATLLDIELLKTQTRTNWLARPLDPSQIDYALDDVRYLSAVRVLLMSRIVVPEIKGWLQEELTLIGKPQNIIDDRVRFRKIKGTSSLNREQLAILRELTAWREREARHANRPRGHIISDTNLRSLAQKHISSETELAQANLLSPKKLKRYGHAIVTCFLAASATTSENLPETERPLRLTPKEKSVYERLVGYVHLKCDLQGLDPQLVGSATELRQLAKNLTSADIGLPPRLTGGWRKTFLEDFFRQRS